ncbi:MAG: PepSY domain-containing protein [Shinella zoogloeoides]|uniref:PepSY domain-containing protein n=1 Tax=Shinella zoogloeoides TaxID=352475 RepID=UPI003C752863
MTGTNTFALAFALMLGMALPALADQPGADWMPLEEVVGKLKAAGYTAIHQIEADDGRWEGEGMKNGTRMEFSADPRTGAILTEHPDN